MNDNDIELYGDNQDVMLTKDDLSIFDEVDEVIARLSDSHDIGEVISIGRAWVRNVRVRGVAMAKLLWAVKDKWSELGIEDEFYDVMENEMGLAVATIHKYINMWEAIFANERIPDGVKKRLLAKPTKTLLLLTGLASEGEDVDWEAVIRASNHNEVRQIIKGARGDQTSSSTAVRIYIDMRSGQLSCRKGGGMAKTFGLLNMDRSEDEVQTAIERIIREAHIETT